MTKPGKYTPRAISYENTPEQVKHREERNRSRREAEKAGKLLAGKDVAHIKPLARGGSNKSVNERVETIARNRGWRKGDTGRGTYRVPDDK